VTTCVKNDEHTLPAPAHEVCALAGPVSAASEAIAEARRVRAEAADELAAWAAILHRAA
jgi:hypothetical protein